MEANEFSVLDFVEMSFLPTGAFELGFGCVESADDMSANAHDCVGIGTADEVRVVVMPLEGLFAMEGFSEKEREVALTVELEIVRDRGGGDFADGGEPVDGSGGGVDDRVGFDSCGPVGDGGDVDGAIPEAVFVAAVGGGGAVIAIFLSFPERRWAVVGGEEDDGVVFDI